MKKPLFSKICIIGVGLIGGSLGLAIKKRRLAKFVVGVVRRKQSAIEAVQKKAVDMATLDLKEGVRGADLVILAGPIPAIISQIKQIGKGDPTGRPYIQRNTIVIDVGSSKVEINHTARQHFHVGAGLKPAPTFVGCHPMAGSEKCGIEFADANLFQGAISFMIHKNTKVENFWKSLGSKPAQIKENEHDAWVAKSSHLPHALSFSLFQMVDSKYPYNPSLKDMARLAHSHSELWADIFLSNQKQVLKAVGEFEKSFSNFQKALKTKNKAALVRFIHHANKQAA